VPDKVVPLPVVPPRGHRFCPIYSPTAAAAFSVNKLPSRM